MTEKATKIEKPKIILIKDLIKETWIDYKMNWEKFGILLIVPLALSFVVNVVLYFIELYAINLAWYWWVMIGVVVAVAMIVFIVLYLMSYIAQFLLLKDLNQEVSFSNLSQWLKKSKPYFWTIMAVSIIYSLFSLVGFILLIIPGIIFMVYYCFSIYFVIFEDHKFEGSFGLSRELVRGYWWAVFGRFLLGLLLIYAFYLIVGGIFALLIWLVRQFMSISIDQNTGSLIYNFFSIFVGLVVGPLTMIYTYNIFKSLKAIKK